MFISCICVRINFMILFVLTLLPLSLLIYYFQREKTNRAHLLPVMFIGFFTGCVFCAYKILFSNPYYLPESSFGRNFLYYFLGQTFFPVLVVYGLFFLFTNKDTLSERISYFFPITGSFYSLYLPYRVLETPLPYSGFQLFIKPLLYLGLLIFIHLWLSKRVVNHPTPKQSAVNYTALVLAVIWPSLIETIWFMNTNWLFYFVPAVLFLAVVGILLWPKSNIED